MSEFTPATADAEPPATAAADPDVDDEVYPGSDQDPDVLDLPENDMGPKP